MATSNKQIRWAVFLVPWLLAIATVILNFISGEAFNAVIMSITNFILDKFSWMFSLTAFICVMVGFIVLRGYDAKLLIPLIVSALADLISGGLIVVMKNLSKSRDRKSVV